MKHLMMAAAVAALFALPLVACSDDGANGAADAAGSDLPTVLPDVASGSDLGGVGTVLTHKMTSSSTFDWSIPQTAPPRNAGCAAPLTDNPGAAYPWTGFTHAGTTYTCNRCPSGRTQWHATWRAIFVGADNELDVDAAHPSDASYTETLEFNGNAFRNVIHGTDLGQTVTAVIEGWYFCGQKPEVNNESTFIIVTSVTPPGAFGFDEGLLYTADILGTEAGESILYSYYEDVVTSSGPGWAGTQPYCRVGVNYFGKPCTDPF
jgi:hypothetical protein